VGIWGFDVVDVVIVVGGSCSESRAFIYEAEFSSRSALLGQGSNHGSFSRSITARHRHIFSHVSSHIDFIDIRG